MIYQVPQHINKDKIFIINRSEIEGRLEPVYYRPSIALLERKIRSLSTKKLRNYAFSIAGGATPKKQKLKNIIQIQRMEFHFLEYKIFKLQETYH